MYFASSPAARRLPSVLPRPGDHDHGYMVPAGAPGISLLPALLVLAMVCFSLSRAGKTIRLPARTLPRPPVVRETPTITVRLSRQGAVTLAGQGIAEGALTAAWQREGAALNVLGFEPSQTMVVVRADRDVPTDKVQQLLEKVQEAGFTQCVLRPAEPPPGPRGNKATVFDQSREVPRPKTQDLRPASQSRGSAIQSPGPKP